MSTTSFPAASETPPTAAPPGVPAPLAALRAELDEIDSALHDLLIRRAEVVGRVAALGVKGRVNLRAGREADIIRRLLARHRGQLPRGALVRIWRELLAATTAMQGAFSVAVGDAVRGGPCERLAREHFGALTPVRVHGSPMQAISELSAGTASVAVLPLPIEDEPAPLAWWTALLHRDDPRIYVVARLPFWQPPGRGGDSGCLVAAAVPPDPSAQDRSLIGLELLPGISRARLAEALQSAGLSQRGMIVRREASSGSALALVEAEGLVRDGDRRLLLATVAARPPVVLGAYAVPIAEAV